VLLFKVRVATLHWKKKSNHILERVEMLKTFSNHHNLCARRVDIKKRTIYKYSSHDTNLSMRTVNMKTAVNQIY